MLSLFICGQVFAAALIIHLNLWICGDSKQEKRNIIYYYMQMDTPDNFGKQNEIADETKFSSL